MEVSRRKVNFLINQCTCTLFLLVISNFNCHGESTEKVDNIQPKTESFMMSNQEVEYRKGKGIIDFVRNLIAAGNVYPATEPTHSLSAYKQENDVVAGYYKQTDHQGYQGLYQSGYFPIYPNSQNVDNTYNPNLHEASNVTPGSTGLLSALSGFLNAANSNNDVYNPLQNQSPVSNSGILQEVSEVLQLINFERIEGMVDKLSKFDKLKCIPRIICQIVARRMEEDTSVVDTSKDKANITVESKLSKNSTARTGRVYKIKIKGVDAALSQFVGFLDMMNLNGWSMYPYIKGASEGMNVDDWNQCSRKFSSCPFSDQQLVYYFNNYNGGLFQSFRSNG